MHRQEVIKLNIRLNKQLYNSKKTERDFDLYETSVIETWNCHMLEELEKREAKA